MCPMCVTTLVLATAGTASAGGLGLLALTRVPTGAPDGAGETAGRPPAGAAKTVARDAARRPSPEPTERKLR